MSEADQPEQAQQAQAPASHVLDQGFERHRHWPEGTASLARVTRVNTEVNECQEVHGHNETGGTA